MNSGNSLLVLVLLLLALSHGTGAEKQIPFRRCAIIASQDIQEEGLPDLLTAQLSNVDGIELVERQELARVTQELELSALLGAGAASNRLQLGRLVKADVLLLVSLEEHEGKKFLGLVIADCSYGARLQLDYLPYDATQLDKIAEECATVVQTTRKKFTGGIRHIVCVTPFLSKNFTHKHDHLQYGYASLLKSSLSDLPGVALVETEEARAIGDELRRTGGEVRDRAVPLFVEGEFKIDQPADGEPTVHLALRVTDGSRVRLDEAKHDISNDQAITLLSEDWPRKISHLLDADRTAGLSRKKQCDLLTSRADAFSQAGAWQHSTGLREAALLLHPDDFEQRLALVSDYRHWHYSLHRNLTADRAWQVTISKKAKSPTAEDDRWWRQLNAGRLERFRLMAVHVEHVIRNHKVNPLEADMLASIVRDNLSYLRLPVEDQSDEAHKAYAEFFWAVYAHFAKLDYNVGNGSRRAIVKRCFPLMPLSQPTSSRPASPEYQLDWWTSNALNTLLDRLRQRQHHVWGGGHNKPLYVDHGTLDDLYRFMTEIVPQSQLMNTAVGLAASRKRGLSSMIDAGRFSADEVLCFYEKLGKSEMPLNEFYARCGLLAMRVRGQSNAPIDNSALEEANELLDVLNTFKIYQRPGSVDAREVLLDLRNEISRKLELPAVTKSHRITLNPIPDFDPSAHVTFTPVAGVRPDWEQILKCNDSLDVMWTSSRVDVMAQRGIVKTIYHSDDPLGVSDVQWDGQHIWIAARQSGIHIYSPDGTQVALVTTEHGLPQYTSNFDHGFRRTPQRHPLRIHAIAPGRCLAVGRSGEHQRVWIADVTEDKNALSKPAFRVKVFHTATKVSGATDNSKEDPEEIFLPTWFEQFINRQKPQQRLILMGRAIRANEQITGRRPLAIDPQSLDVSIFPCGFSGRTSNDVDVVAVDGQFVSADFRGLWHHRPTSDAVDAQWRREAVIELEPPFRPGRIRLLQHQGQVLVLGERWLRYDREERQFETLSKSPAPHQYRFDRYGVSAHYGPVAWNVGAGLYQIEVGDQKLREIDLASTYPFVPTNLRGQHHRTVEAIRRSGGHVDHIFNVTLLEIFFGKINHGERSRNKSGITGVFDESGNPWRTFVFLSDQWKGGDAELNHLSDLYNLQALYVVRAPITDKGLEQIGKLRDLRTLELIETKASDAGLINLKGLTRLNYLRLEGSAGGSEFSNKGLEHLTGLPQLKLLTLYGHEFSDMAIRYVEQIACLRRLTLFDTSFTVKALDELRQKRPSFQWSNR
jgi:hypothetical protein